MKKTITLPCIIFSMFCFFLNLVSFAQSFSGQGNNAGGNTYTKNGKKFQVKWTTNPFDNHVFIANNGQFDGRIKSDEKILYGAHLGKIDVYFTPHKIVYRYNKNYLKKSSDGHFDPDDPKYSGHKTYFLSAEWQESSDAVSIEGRDELQAYFTYGAGENATIKANGFKQIIYKNLYPGIDAIFGFVDGKTGLKYSLIIHPGADLSKVKIHYSGVKSIVKNKEGEILIKSELDLLTEQAPVAGYPNKPGNIAFSNILDGNIESFKADENYDKSKTLIIDPWLTDPLFTSIDEAYDLCWDYKGNVYAYGGDNSPWQLVKMNNLGIIQWTFSADTLINNYGAFATDKYTGTSYVCQGAFHGKVIKVNTLGNLIATYDGAQSYISELWRAKFDPCNHNVIIGGGGVYNNYQAVVLDTNMTSFKDTVNALGATSGYHDISLMAIDPDGYHCYMAAAKSAFFDPLHFDNYMMSLPLPSLSPTLYSVHENCHFVELSSVTYVFNSTNGMNGAAASPNWLYLYNGDTVRRYHKNTGALTTQFGIRRNSPFRYGGIDVDACDNLFVGVQDTIYVMDSTYSMYTKIPLTDTVFDVQLGQNGALYACGIGFVTEIINPVTPALISSVIATPSSCFACNGTATVNVNCGVSPYSFHWSNGSTNETNTGLCAGIYSIRVTDGACPPGIDTAVIIVNSEPGYYATVTDTNVGCGRSKGNAMVHTTGGSPPYTYLWSNGCTNPEDTGLVAGTYTCVITDIAGCKAFASVTIINVFPPIVVVNPAKDTICAGTSVPILASGAKTYSWSPSLGLSCNSCPNPTATPTATTTYSVTGTDSVGCNDTKTVTIQVYSAKPLIKGKDSICAGYTDTLIASGGTSYLWSTSATTDSIYVYGIINEVITLIASEWNCWHDTSITIHVVPPPVAYIGASKDTVCSGDSVLLTGGGGATYRWSTGNTNSSIWVTPHTTRTYTLYVSAGTCSDSITKQIEIIPPLIASIGATKDTICPNGTTTITATGNESHLTYQWNNGSTTSSINVSPSVTSRYIVTIYGQCDSATKDTLTITVIPPTKPTISGSTSKCKDEKDTLSVSGGMTYLWSNGVTEDKYYTGDIDADSTITVISYNSFGCADTGSFTITISPSPGILLTDTNNCLNSPAIIHATATGTGPFTYLWSPGGETNNSITVPDTGQQYTVKVSNGCSAKQSISLIPIIPTLNVCCNKIIFQGDDTTLVAYGDSILSYQWSPEGVCINPPLCDSVKVNPTVTTTYTVIGNDILGCQTQKIVTLVVEIPCFNFTVPNVFTPGNAGTLGMDDKFYINTGNITDWTESIYDRWGKVIYQSSNPKEYWDGTTKSGSEAPAGIYYYIISGTCLKNTYHKQGFVQLIR